MPTEESSVFFLNLGHVYVDNYLHNSSWLSCVHCAHHSLNPCTHGMGWPQPAVGVLCACHLWGSHTHHFPPPTHQCFSPCASQPFSLPPVQELQDALVSPSVLLPHGLLCTLLGNFQLTGCSHVLTLYWWVWGNRASRKMLAVQV